MCHKQKGWGFGITWLQRNCVVKGHAAAEMKSKLLIYGGRWTMMLLRKLTLTGGGWTWNAKGRHATYLQIRSHLYVLLTHPRRLTYLKYRLPLPLVSSGFSQWWEMAGDGGYIPLSPSRRVHRGLVFPCTEWYCFCEWLSPVKLSFWIAVNILSFRAGRPNGSAVTSFHLCITSFSYNYPHLYKDSNIITLSYPK